MAKKVYLDLDCRHRFFFPSRFPSAAPFCFCFFLCCVYLSQSISERLGIFRIRVFSGRHLELGVFAKRSGKGISGNSKRCFMLFTQPDTLNYTPSLISISKKTITPFGVCVYFSGNFATQQHLFCSFWFRAFWGNGILVLLTEQLRNSTQIVRKSGKEREKKGDNKKD